MKAKRKTKKILDPQEYACSLIEKWDWKDTVGLLRYMVSVWKQEYGEAKESSPTNLLVMLSLQAKKNYK